MINWKVIQEDYLRTVESRIPYSDYGSDKMKPFFGALFETEEFIYVTQVSHAKPRHEKMTNNIDFLKIYEPKTNRLLSVVNLNYMFPVPKAEIIDLTYKNIELHRTFVDEEEKSKYIDLLKTELKELRSSSVSKKALKVYENKYNNPSSMVAKRSFDFKDLEIKAKEWKKA